MQIRQLHIDGFGCFKDYTLSGLQAGVNILTGANEAGKSTLLHFIRFTLFGYPRLVEQRLPPFAGGDHGGRIEAEISDGTRLTFQRRAGYPGDIRLTYAHGQSSSENEWFRLLGQGTLSLFENVYGISLEELVGLESLSRSGVEDRIFSVGLGLADVSLGAVEKALREQAENLYKPRGAKQQLPQLLQQLDREKAQVAEIQSKLPRYQALTREIARMSESLAEIEAELATQQAAYDRFRNYGQCYASYVTIAAVDQELAQLPALADYPENGRETLDQLEVSEAAQEKAVAQRRANLDRMAQALANTSYNADLLEQSRLVEKIKANFEKYKTMQQQYHEEKNQWHHYEAALQRGRQLLPADWTEERIRDLTEIIAHRDQLSRYQAQLADLERKKEQARLEYAALANRPRWWGWKNLLLFIGLILLAGAALALWAGWPLAAGGMLVAGLMTLMLRWRWPSEDPTAAAQRKLTTVEDERQQFESDYADYLAQYPGFPPDLSPAAALETLRLVEDLQPKILAKERLAVRLTEMEDFISDFQGTVSAVAGCLPAEDSEAEIEHLVWRIDQAFQENAAVRDKKVALRQEYEAETAAWEQAQEELDRLQNRIKGLLTAIGAGDREEFRRRYRDNERVAALQTERKQAWQVVQQIVGVTQAGPVLADLAEYDKADLDRHMADIGQQVHDLRQKRDELNRSISAKTTERAQLVDAAALSESLTRLEVTREKMREAYQNWLSAQTALTVLQRVKQRYEQDRQPAVIRNSSRYFRKITGGQYQRVSVSLEERRVSVFDRHGKEKHIGQLSRGTREQLLISLRLGFIAEYEKETEPLPLVLDDVLVNFDDQRARRTAAVIHDFSQPRQTLFFTCHSEWPGLFEKRPVTVLSLDDPTATGSV